MTAVHQIRGDDRPHGNRKYGAEDAKRWRKMIAVDRMSRREICEKEGVGRTTLDNILEIF